MRISTTNYEDFRRLVAGLFGDTYVTFYGVRPAPHHNESIVLVTNKEAMVVYTSHVGLPESFNQEFVKAIALAEISEVKWGP